MTDQEIAQIVKDAIREGLSGASFPQCALEQQRIEAIEELSKKLSIIITGNGNPENGLASKQTSLAMSVETFHVEMRKEVAEIKDREKEKRTREWGMIMVGVGMIATSLWGLIVP
jgi:4-hydroxy-3-methylbut-2-enyl diphosphate reductase IspH